MITYQICFFLTNADYDYVTTNTEIILIGNLDTGKTFNIDIKILCKDFNSLNFIEIYRYDDYTAVDIFSPLFLVLNKYTDILSSMTINDIDYRHNIRNLCNEVGSLEYKVWGKRLFLKSRSVERIKIPFIGDKKKFVTDFTKCKILMGISNI